MSAPFRRADRGWAALFLLPLGLGLFLFNGLPLLQVAWNAFHRWDLLGPARAVGLANFGAVLADPRFHQALGQTVAFGALEVALEVGAGLWLAALLDAPLRERGVYRAAFFLPVTAGTAALAIAWGFLLDAQAGPLAHLFPAWPGLADPAWAFASVVVLSAWKHVGVAVLLFLAALSQLPEPVLEAAKLDGARGLGLWRWVTLPLLAPAVAVVALLGAINALTAFDWIYLLTQGGPEGRTMVLGYWIYQEAFEYFRVGRAAVATLLLAAAAFAVGALRRRTAEDAA